MQQPVPRLLWDGCDVKLGSGARIFYPDLVNLYGCTVGAETTVGPFVEIQRNAVVGARCRISSHSFICEGITIEDEVFVGHGVMFTNDIYPRATTDSGAVKTAADWQVIETRVRRRASIGSNATILAGVTIGEGALVGAVHNRKLLQECLGLKDWIVSRPVAAVVSVRIPRRGASPARTAAMELRYGTVTLLPSKGPKGRAALAMQVVHIVEQTPRKAVEPVEWFLLTTCAVDTPEQAAETVRWYTRRWGIEAFHRILKSGCRIEDRQLATEARIENCLAIDLVVAWPEQKPHLFDWTRGGCGGTVRAWARAGQHQTTRQ